MYYFHRDSVSIAAVLRGGLAGFLNGKWNLAKDFSDDNPAGTQTVAYLLYIGPPGGRQGFAVSYFN